MLDYLLDGDVDARAIYDALGTSSSTYYRRIKEADYPNAEEMRLVADRFNLSYPDLQVRFGLMTRDEVWSYVQSAPMSVATIAKARTEWRTVRGPRLRDLTPRTDAPPL